MVHDGTGDLVRRCGRAHRERGRARDLPAMGPPSDHSDPGADARLSDHAVRLEADLMERRIRRLGIFMILCFLAIFIQLNNIQVIKANSLANDPNNPAVIAISRSQTRGSILSSDGVVLASSVLAPHGDIYKYQRVYNPYTTTL